MWSTNVLYYKLKSRDSVNFGKLLFMHIVHMSAQAGHAKNGIQHQSHATGGPHYHYRHPLRLDHEMLVVFGESTRKHILLRLFFANSVIDRLIIHRTYLIA